MKIALLFLVAICAAAAPATAQLTVPWSSLDAGGGVSTGGGFTVKGTIGQPDSPATATSTTGGPFVLRGGYWDLPSNRSARAVRVSAEPDAIVYCPADVNFDQAVNTLDLYDFLDAYFNDDWRADFNRSGSSTVEDLFDFLNEYTAGCG